MIVPGKFTRAKFADFKGITAQLEAVTKVYHLAKKNRSIIILNPDTGIGKTHLAVAAFKLSWQYDTKIEKDCFGGPTGRRFRYDMHRSVFVPVWKDGKELEHAYYRHEEKMAPLYKARRLLLDDLTTEPDGAKESIESLFRHFYDHGKQIIATAPMTFDQFTAHYNGCITRRMDDMGVFVELSGERYRDKQGIGH